MTSLRAAVGLLRLLQDAHVEAGLPVDLIRTPVEARGPSELGPRGVRECFRE